MAFWPVRLASVLMRGLGLVAAQTRMFLFTDIDCSTAVRQLLDDPRC